MRLLRLRVSIVIVRLRREARGARFAASTIVQYVLANSLSFAKAGGARGGNTVQIQPAAEVARLNAW